MRLPFSRKPTPPAVPEPTLTHEEQVLKELKENNRLLRLNVAAQTEFRWRFLGGVWTGLGTVMGATVLIAIIVRILAGLATVDRIGPYVRELQQTLEKPQVGRQR